MDLVWPFALLPLAALVTTIGIFIRLPRSEYRARLKRLPWWARWGGPLCGFYSVAMGLNQIGREGRPKSIDSGFALSDHGHVLRSLTEPEYCQLAREEVAFIFGSLLWFACGAIIDRAVGRMSPPNKPFQAVTADGRASS